MIRNAHFWILLCSTLLLTNSFLFGVSFSQSLSLQKRSSIPLSGNRIAAVITPMSRESREERIFEEIVSGNIPDFLRTLIPVTSSAIVEGRLNTITYFVTPDYLALGSNEDYFLCPMTPRLAQRLADTLRCILPTRKMVNDIYAAASLKLEPEPIPPSPEMTTVPVFARHDSLVWARRRSYLETHPLGTLVGGTKKDVVISNQIRTGLKPGVSRPVVIYGWHKYDGTPIQPLYNGHGDTYADYSHGIRLVLDSIQINGNSTTISAVLQDPQLSAIFSDEGPISNPRYGSPPPEE